MSDITRDLMIGILGAPGVGAIELRVVRDIEDDNTIKWRAKAEGELSLSHCHAIGFGSTPDEAIADMTMALMDMPRRLR